MREMSLTSGPHNHQTRRRPQTGPIRINRISPTAMKSLQNTSLQYHYVVPPAIKNLHLSEMRLELLLVMYIAFVYYFLAFCLSERGVLWWHVIDEIDATIYSLFPGRKYGIIFISSHTLFRSIRSLLLHHHSVSFIRYISPLVAFSFVLYLCLYLYPSLISLSFVSIYIYILHLHLLLNLPPLSLSLYPSLSSVYVLRLCLHSSFIYTFPLSSAFFVSVFVLHLHSSSPSTSSMEFFLSDSRYAPVSPEWNIVKLIFDAFYR